MKKLKLGEQLHKKLDRLSDKVGDLNFIGVDPNLLIKNPVVAVVGTRKPTPYGKQVTEKIVTELCKNGVVIVSGLAFGIDITAHKTALESNGQTIAVLPSGINNIYPATHINIAKKIVENGSLISEYPENHKPRNFEFLERNRIIAALADVVVIPEAAERSGSLNTASHARRMGIPVFAVPGPINSNMSSGTNQLIKSGEKILTSVEDIESTLKIKPKDKKAKLTGENEQETAILQLISSGIKEVDKLQLATGINSKEFLIHITSLEINGQIKQDDLGNWFISE